MEVKVLMGQNLWDAEWEVTEPLVRLCLLANSPIVYPQGPGDWQRMGQHRLSRWR